MNESNDFYWSTPVRLAQSVGVGPVDHWWVDICYQNLASKWVRRGDGRRHISLPAPEKRLVVGRHLLDRLQHQAMLGRGPLQVVDVAQAPQRVALQQRLVEGDVALRTDRTVHSVRSVGDEEAARLQQSSCLVEQRHRALPRRDVNHVYVEHHVVLLVRQIPLAQVRQHVNQRRRLHVDQVGLGHVLLHASKTFTRFKHNFLFSFVIQRKWLRVTTNPVIVEFFKARLTDTRQLLEPENSLKSS